MTRVTVVGLRRRLVLGLVAASLLVAIVNALPRRIVPNEGKAEVPQMGRDVGHKTHRHSSSHESKPVEEIDFSGLDALMDGSASGDGTTTTLAELNAEVGERARSRNQMVGDVPLNDIQDISEAAVQHALQLIGMDQPIEDEKNMNAYWDGDASSSGRHEVLLESQARSAIHETLSHQIDQKAGAATAAAAAEHQQEAASAPSPSSISERMRFMHRARHGGRKAPRALQRPMSPEGMDSDAAAFIEFDAIDRSPRRRREAYQKLPDDPVEAALTEVNDEVRSPEQQKIEERTTRQPTSRELFEFFAKNAPKSIYGPAPENYQHYDPNAAPSGGDEKEERFADAGIRAQVGMMEQGAEGGSGGYNYKPSEFKHPPPPPVPPPPPPPPPPQFGANSPFSGYKFIPEGSSPPASFLETWEQMYPASPSAEAKAEEARQQQQTQEPEEQNNRATDDGFETPSSFAEFWSKVSGEHQHREQQHETEEQQHETLRGPDNYQYFQNPYESASGSFYQYGSHAGYWDPVNFGQYPDPYAYYGDYAQFAAQP